MKSVGLNKVILGYNRNTFDLNLFIYYAALDTGDDVLKEFGRY